jgi:hypothetical protein
MAVDSLKYIIWEVPIYSRLSYFLYFIRNCASSSSNQCQKSSALIHKRRFSIIFFLPFLPFIRVLELCWILKQFMGAKKRVGTELSYRPTRLCSLAASIPRNQFLGSLNIYKFVLFCLVCLPAWVLQYIYKYTQIIFFTGISHQYKGKFSRKFNLYARMKLLLNKNAC